MGFLWDSRGNEGIYNPRPDEVLWRVLFQMEIPACRVYMQKCLLECLSILKYVSCWPYG